MAKPTNRQEFKQYCLRALGAPVLDINVDDDQLEDRIDESLQFYRDYHFDASEMVFYKHAISEQDRQNGYILLPENIMGAVEILPLGGFSGGSADLLFNVEYQFMMNELFNYTSISVIPYFMARNHLALLQELFSGQKLIRYARHKNKLYVDMNWNTLSPATLAANATGTVIVSNTSTLVTGSSTTFLTDYANGNYMAVYSSDQQYELHEIKYVNSDTSLTLTANGKFSSVNAKAAKATSGQFLLVRAYEVIDPDEYKDVWSDNWLYKYCTAKFKQQWGNNMKKFEGMQLPGGITMNGQKIYEEATAEIDKMEEEMTTKYSPILFDLVG